MSVPLRKSEIEDQLTTADLAQGKRPAVSEDLHKPVLAERSTTERVENAGAGERTAPILRLRPTPLLCFLPMNWKGSGIAGAGFRRLLSMSRAGQWNKRMAWLPLR